MRKLISAVLAPAVVFATPALLSAGDAVSSPRTNSSLRIATFDVNATPAVGSLLAYDRVVNDWDLTLRARGIVLLGAGQPMVLCAVDWIGIANAGHDAFCSALAQAVGTSPERVAIHALHQHDAPDCDFSSERILLDAGLEPQQYEGSFQRQVLTNLAAAARAALAQAQPVTELGLGSARVEGVASNRRIPGPDGKVRAVRWSATTDAQVRAEPEGVIDPELSLVSFWNGSRPIAVLSYYATHPQSYYRTGIPNPDFPGIARFYRQLAVPEALHVHFDGAGGNIAAGKYNDGSPVNRGILAQRLADGMRRAWENTQRAPITAREVGWQSVGVALPPAKHLSLEQLETQANLRDPKLARSGDASRLAWLRRCAAGHKITLSCLRLGRARILHMPGELFVEYQLAAKAMRPDCFVAMAAYGDYGPGYIGTARAYAEGGYETSPDASNVAPEVEGVLMGGMRELLEVSQ